MPRDPHTRAPCICLTLFDIRKRLIHLVGVFRFAVKLRTVGITPTLVHKIRSEHLEQQLEPLLQRKLGRWRRRLDGLNEDMLVYG
jgi:hypothetical protein